MIFPDHARGQPSVAVALPDDDLVVRLSCSFLTMVVRLRGSSSRRVTVVRSCSRDSPTVTPVPFGPTPTPTRVSAAHPPVAARCDHASCRSGVLRPNPDKMLEQSKEEDSTTSLVTLPGSIADSVLDAAGNYLLKPSA